MNYYNEHDPQASAWIEELVASADLPPGLVDSRDVQAVGPGDLLHQYDQCHFFAGIGGWPHALDLAGWPRDKPIWTASLPCQPWSDAGKQLGVDDERHLWPAFRDLVAHYRPQYLVGEQVASKAGRAWLADVQVDLEALGYRSGATDICAASIGAPHIRQRLFWCAYRVPDTLLPGFDGSGASRQARRSEPADHGIGTEGMGNPGGKGLQRRYGKSRSQERQSIGRAGSVRRVPDPEARRRSEVDQDPGRRDERSTTQGMQRPVGSGHDDWNDVVYVPCSDGKSRPIKSRAQPMADGLSGVVVPGSDSSSPEVESREEGETQIAVPPLVFEPTDDVNDTDEARAMRLKGYGNAIVAPLAAEFLQSFMDILQDLQA